MGLMVVYLVVNGEVLDGYTTDGHASLHARAVTGARVVPLYVRDRLNPAIVSDLAAELDEEDLTPVETPIADLTGTRPSTPRAIARQRKPLK